MSLLADALQPLVANGLFTVGGRLPDISLTGAITAPNSAYALSFDATVKQISLDFRDPAYVRTLIAADMSRLATSCLQSISVSPEVSVEKYWLPWTLVRIYYAAFYAAHATVRALGVGCCWLDTDDINHLQALANATFNQSVPWSVSSGTYRCDADTRGAFYIGQGSPGGRTRRFGAYSIRFLPIQVRQCWQAHFPERTLKPCSQNCKRLDRCLASIRPRLG